MNRFLSQSSLSLSSRNLNSIGLSYPFMSVMKDLGDDGFAKMSTDCKLKSMQNLSFLEVSF